MKQRRTVGIHAESAPVDYLPQIPAYRALVAGQSVYRIALTTMPKENS